MFKNKSEFKREYARRLVEAYGCAVEETHPTEKYMVLGNMVCDYASINWKDTKAAVKYFNAKQVYYFSIEFLLGKMLTSNLKNLGIYEIAVPSAWVGESILDLKVRSEYGVEILAFQLGGDVEQILDPDFVFEKDMHLYVIGAPDAIRRITRNKA